MSRFASAPWPLKAAYVGVLGASALSTVRFRQMKSLQTFSAVHGSVHNPFNQERRLTDRETYKTNRPAALAEWRALMA